MAFRETIFKKRLAFSTVSQVSYVLFGLFVMDEAAFRGGLLHIVFHSVIKNLLFLTAGVIIFYTGKTHVDEYEGYGKKMPTVMVCYTLCSLGLVGIPPLPGFVSKWYLATGAYQAQIGVFRWLGPVILLISALLTAVYLLQICVKSFFPKPAIVDNSLKKASKHVAEETDTARIKVSWLMLIPMIIYTILNVLFGIFTGPLGQVIDGIANSIF